MNKKQIRAAFVAKVLRRDQNRCRKCGRSDVKLDAHHIIDRKIIANGGYCLENGITLCDDDEGCHWKAERYHATGQAIAGYSPEDLFNLIGSSQAIAERASERL